MSTEGASNHRAWGCHRAAPLSKDGTWGAAGGDWFARWRRKSEKGEDAWLAGLIVRERNTGDGS
jgi:hypothetical protein